MTDLSKKKKKPYWLFTLIVIILLIISWVLFMRALDFANTHTFKKNPVVAMQFKMPITIAPKEEPKVIETFKPIEYTAEVDTPLKQYICDKFGAMDCKIALGIAQAESGFRSDAFNINTNDTIDIGVFQINSVHFKQAGCSLEEVVFANKNVDCAYSIWKASGWKAWSAYNNSSYLAQLDK